MSSRQLSLRNFADLFDAAPDAIVVVNDGGTIEFANRRTEDLFGWPCSELIGQLIEQLVPERMRRSHLDDRSRYIASPSTRPMGSGRELLARRRDGSEFPVEISLSPLHTDSGLLVSSIIRDVSERRTLESAARRTGDHLRSAVESIQDAFALFDVDDRLVLCNSTYRQIFGGTLDGPVAGRSYLEILDAALDGGVLEQGAGPGPTLRQRWIDHHARLDAPLDVTTSGGRSLRIAERRTPEGGTVVLIWDLTEDARRAAELQRLQVIAEAASSAKSEFLSSMSHELRTPLNAVLGFAQLLRRDKKQPLDDRQRTMVDHVIRGGEHLLRLIDDVLDLSHIEAGRVTISTEPVRVAGVLCEVTEALGPMAARAAIDLVMAPMLDETIEIAADRTRFVQILMNYGSNAIKYGRPGGTVTFAVSDAGSCHGRSAHVQSAHVHSAHVRISVIDDGIGIAREKHARIFQPFQRAGQETGPIEGTGIGLAITRRLAQLMQGEVGFDSHLGRGSEFWVELPRAQPQAQAVAAAEPRGAVVGLLGDAHAPRLAVVYIEDNPANVEFMRQLLLEFERIELHVATTAEDGLELVRRLLPSVVIMDINLPGMSGFEATRHLRADPVTREVPVIGLSAAAMPRDRKQAEECDFDHYLTKPVDVDALVAALEEVLARPRP